MINELYDFRHLLDCIADILQNFQHHISIRHSPEKLTVRNRSFEDRTPGQERSVVDQPVFPVEQMTVEIAGVKV